MQVAGSRLAGLQTSTPVRKSSVGCNPTIIAPQTHGTGPGSMRSMRHHAENWQAYRTQYFLHTHLVGRRPLLAAARCSLLSCPHARIRCDWQLCEGHVLSDSWRVLRPAFLHSYMYLVDRVSPSSFCSLYQLVGLSSCCRRSWGACSTPCSCTRTWT